MSIQISIITVTYNCVELIENTIKSILNQNSDQIEYIIIDGQSTDLIDGKMLRLVSWYDNEWGYSCRMADLLRLMGQ